MDYALPSDSFMLLSYVNTKLRDEYPSLEAMCDDMQLDRDRLEETLAEAGFTYNPKNNKFW